jgi:hypothetical protein
MRFASTKITSLTGLVPASRGPQQKVGVFTADFTFTSNTSHLTHHMPGEVDAISQTVHMSPVATW